MYCCFCKNKYFNKPVNVFSNILKKEVKYFQCKKCKSIHQNPLPNHSDLKRYYEKYFNIKKKMNPGYLEENNMHLLFRERDKTLNEIGFPINRFSNTQNVEVGCANGHFLKYLINKNAENIIGIDISKELIDSIKIKNIKLIVGDLSVLKNNFVDNLFLFNILEHFINVDNYMKQIKNVIKNNAYIIVEVPLAGTISSFFKNNWRFLMPDEHLHIPSYKGLKIFFKENGFKLIGKTRFGSGYTKGMINPKLKYFFDYFAKIFQYGDRGTFLFKYTKKYF